MRILHFSDLHLGMENYGRTDPTTGLSTRLGDFLAVLDEVVDYALTNAVDLVLFSGDAYKTRDPSPTHQREFARRIKRLTEAGLPVFLLVGNHDLPNALGRAHSVEIFATLDVSHTHVARRIGTWRIKTRNGEVQIVALPWVVRSNLLTKDDYRSLPLDKLDARVATLLDEQVQGQVEELASGVPAVLCAHGSVEGAVFGSERSVMLGQDILIPRSLVNNPAFSYVALGHIHKHQVVNQDPPAVYAGSLERIDFGEEHDAKGFVVVDLEGTRRAKWTFVPVHARRFLTIKADAGYDDPTDMALRAIARHDVKDAVVKLIVQARTNTSLRDDEVRRALADAYFVAGVSCEATSSTRSRLGDLAVEQMTPLDALAAYLRVKEIPEKRAAALLDRARRLLSGEEQG